MTDQTDDFGERWAAEIRAETERSRNGPDPADDRWLFDFPDKIEGDQVTGNPRAERDLIPVPIDAKPSVVLRQAAEIVAERREPDWLLDDVLERAVLAVMSGSRGCFKSFVALDWSMRAVVQGHTVVILSGEGAGLDRRIDAWMRTHGKGYDLATLPLYCLEVAINLNDDKPMVGLKAAIERLVSPTPALIVVDTLSKFAGGVEENSNAEMALYLSRLTEQLRDAYACTVLLVAHTGHGNQERPRGAYVLMANPDAEYMVTRPVPNGMHALVSRERFKDTPSLQNMVYTAEVVDLCRVDKRGKPVTSLALTRGGDQVPVKERTEPQGKAQRTLLAGLRNLQRDAKQQLIWSLADLRKIARGAGLSKPTAWTASESLALSSFMQPTIGGYRLPQEDPG